MLHGAAVVAGRICILLALLLVGFPITVSSQSWEEDILQKAAVYTAIHRQEKVFVHTDRPAYAAGETIWFSAYVLSAATQRLNNSERVLYVELLAPDGVLLQKQIFKINDGIAEGQLELQESMQGGSCFLQAYTNWQRNAGSALYFRKQIQISKAGRTASPVADSLMANSAGKQPAVAGEADCALEPGYSMQFYPEGGYLLEGINAKVAFEILDEFGHAVEAAGMVFDEKGEVVAAINAMWNGKGFFMLTPQAGKHYYALIEKQRGEEQHFPLPEAVMLGMNLSVVNHAHRDQLQVNIVLKSESPGESEAFLLCMQHGIARHAVKLKLKADEPVSLSFDKADFKTGIVHFTLFDANKMPRSERLVMIDNQDQLNISVRELNEPKAPRELLELELVFTTNDGQAVKGDFSVSVNDAGRIPSSLYQHHNLVNYLALFSDLGQAIPDAHGLLDNTGSARFKNELLMLTNGWRRYDWHQILADTIALPEYFVESGIYIEGQVMSNMRNNKVKPGIEVTMMISGTAMQLFTEQADDEGRFTFLLNDFNDTLSAVVQTKNRLKNNKDFGLDLKSNIHSKPADYSWLSDWRPIQSDTGRIRTKQVLFEADELSRELSRAIETDTFVITSDYAIGEVLVEGEKRRSAKASITRKYGSPEQSVGRRQINDLVQQKPWHFGLMTVLANAFPALDIQVRPTSIGRSKMQAAPPSLSLPVQSKPSSLIVNENSSILFRLKNEARHRFFVFVDGELVGASDSEGVLSRMFSIYQVDDLIAIDPGRVASVDLIFPDMGKKTSSLHADAELHEYEMQEEVEVPVFEDLAGLEAFSDLYSAPLAVLSVYTNDGHGIFGKEKYKGMVKLNLQGFSRVKEFYHPNYAGSDADSILFDLRSTLAWFPRVQSDSTGKAHLSFYTSDVSDRYRIEINGISESGVPGALIYEREKAIFNRDRAQSDLEVRKQAVSASGSKPYRVLLPDGSPAASVLIRSEKHLWQTISSAGGWFDLDPLLFSDDDQLLLWCAGYQELAVRVGEAEKEALRLNKIVHEAVDIDALELMKEVLKKAGENLSSQHHLYEGACREMLLFNNDLHQLTDFEWVQQWPSLANSSEKVSTHLLNGRRYRSSGFTGHIKFTPQNRSGDALPLFDPFYSAKSFISWNMLKYYQYEVKGLLEWNGRKVFHLVFDQLESAPWALYTGEMYIDAESRGPVWMQWRISPKGYRYLMPDEFLASGGDQQTFELKNERNEMYWNFKDSRWLPAYARSEVNFTQKGNSASIIREAAWNESKGEWSRFTARTADEMEQRSRYNSHPEYQPAQWRKAWLLPSSPIIDEQFRFLKHEVEYKQ